MFLMNYLKDACSVIDEVIKNCDQLKPHESCWMEKLIWTYTLVNVGEINPYNKQVHYRTGIKKNAS